MLTVCTGAHYQLHCTSAGTWLVTPVLHRLSVAVLRSAACCCRASCCSMEGVGVTRSSRLLLHDPYASSDDSGSEDGMGADYVPQVCVCGPGHAVVCCLMSLCDAVLHCRRLRSSPQGGHPDSHWPSGEHSDVYAVAAPALESKWSPSSGVHTDGEAARVSCGAWHARLH